MLKREGNNETFFTPLILIIRFIIIACYMQYTYVF